MEIIEISNDITLIELRELLRVGKEIVGEEEAIEVGLSLWHYSEPPGGSGNRKERIELYRSEGGPTIHVTSLEKAYEVLENWRKEKTNG